MEYPKEWTRSAAQGQGVRGSTDRVFVVIEIQYDDLSINVKSILKNNHYNRVRGSVCNQ